MIPVTKPVSLVSTVQNSAPVLVLVRVQKVFKYHQDHAMGNMPATHLHVPRSTSRAIMTMPALIQKQSKSRVTPALVIALVVILQTA